VFVFVCLFKGKRKKIKSSPKKCVHLNKTQTKMLKLFFSIILVALLAIAIGFYLQSKQTANTTVPKSSTAPFSVCSPINFTLDASSFTPTKQRSNEIVRWTYEATKLFLSFGTRVAGATNEGRFKSLRFLQDSLKCVTNQQQPQHWIYREDIFSEETVIGKKEFTNIVVESNFCGNQQQDAKRRHLVVAAHWDSKLFNEFEFVGACDSAVPVILMIRLLRQVAAVVGHQHNKNNNQTFCDQAPKITFMFLDGEEAFVDWVGDDNTYGSRHLANLYEKEDKIRSISLFMLLDLLGPTRPTFYNYFKDKTGDHYERMRNIEIKQRQNGRRRTKDSAAFFSPQLPRGGVDDDHRPWMQRGVPILHLIPMPFPPEWHKAGDTLESIDFDHTVVDLYNIIAEFTLTF
jgi:glutaminyl-peptide cyclotransferase